MIVFAPNVTADRLRAFTRALDAAAPLPGELWIYSADQPSAGAEISGQLLLARVPFGLPSAGAVNGNVLPLQMSDGGLVIASGAAAWARFVTGAGDWVADCGIGLSGSGAPVELDDLTLYQGGWCQPSVATLTEV